MSKSRTHYLITVTHADVLGCRVVFQRIARRLDAAKCAAMDGASTMAWGASLADKPIAWTQRGHARRWDGISALRMELSGYTLLCEPYSAAGSVLA